MYISGTVDGALARDSMFKSAGQEAYEIFRFMPAAIEHYEHMERLKEQKESIFVEENIG